MTDKPITGESIFNDAFVDQQYHNLYRYDDGMTWVDTDDEPPPRYWDSLAIGIAIGILVGTILAWLPAGLIIWRLWK